MTYALKGSLSTAVAGFLSTPLESMGLMDELAIARATLQPLLDLYAENDTSTKAKILIGDQIRDAIDTIGKIAERAAKIQSQQLITPAQVALLVKQIEAIGQDVLGSGSHEYVTMVDRINETVQLTTHSPAEEGAHDAVRPWDMVSDMDATVPEPEDFDRSNL